MVAERASRWRGRTAGQCERLILREEWLAATLPMETRYCVLPTHPESPLTMMMSRSSLQHPYSVLVFQRQTSSYLAHNLHVHLHLPSSSAYNHKPGLVKRFCYHQVSVKKRNNRSTYLRYPPANLSAAIAVTTDWLAAAYSRFRLERIDERSWSIVCYLRSFQSPRITTSPRISNTALLSDPMISIRVGRSRLCRLLASPAL